MDPVPLLPRFPFSTQSTNKCTPYGAPSTTLMLYENREGWKLHSIPPESRPSQLQLFGPAFMQPIRMLFVGFCFGFPSTHGSLCGDVGGFWRKKLLPMCAGSGDPPAIQGNKTEKVAGVLVASHFHFGLSGLFGERCFCIDHIFP